MASTEFYVHRTKAVQSGPAAKVGAFEGVLTSNCGISGVAIERDYNDPHPCIPASQSGIRYKLTVAAMQSHGSVLRALLLNVLGRFGIFIHSVNWATDLLGCIGAGAKKLEDGLITGGVPIANAIAQAVQDNPDDSWVTVYDIPEEA